MIINHRATILCIAGIFSAACSQAPAPAQASTSAEEVPLAFEEGTVLEVAFSSIEPGHEDWLFKTWFPTALLVAAEHGGRLVGAFRIAAGSIAGREDATTVALFSWPSVDEFLRVTQDPRLTPLLPTRKEAFIFLDEANFFAADVEVSLLLQPGDFLQIGPSKANDGGASMADAFTLPLVPASPGAFAPPFIELSVEHGADGDVPAGDALLAPIPIE